MKNRILIKLSGEALMGTSGYGIDVATINFISKEIKKIANLDYQICLIIGGGNIFRGVKGASEGIDRSTSDYMGMLATIMNALSLQSCLEKIELHNNEIMTPLYADLSNLSSSIGWDSKEKKVLMKGLILIFHYLLL